MAQCVDSVEAEAEAEAAPRAFNDLTDDALSCILSFLSPADISACSCLNRRLRELCKEECKVWMAMCERRWGNLTDLTRWGEGCASFRLVYRILVRWENLIGFWRGVGNGGWGSLTLFDWKPHHIMGQKVVPTEAGGYSVRKVPFLWLGISSEGQPVCLIDPAFKSIGRLNDLETGCNAPHSSNSSSSSSLSGVEEAFPVTSRLGCFSSLELDIEKVFSLGLVPVDMHFVGDHHVIVEEMQQPRSVSVKNSPAEAAALASFGSDCNLAELAKNRSPSPSRSESENVVGSPVGSFQYEMYQFLTRKVTSPGGSRAAWKQRKREKERALDQGRCLSEPEHFVKVMHCCPTKGRPLQGLWKGVFDSVGLDFILVSYDDYGGVICRNVRELSGVPISGSILWTSLLKSHIEMPLPPDEEALYNSRMHIRPMPMSGCSERKIRDHVRVILEPGELVGEEVIGMLSTSSCHSHHRLSSDKREGRVWQYASGNFGFGYLHTDSVIDFRLLCSRDCVLDVD